MTAWLLRVVGNLIHGTTTTAAKSEELPKDDRSNEPIKSLPAGRKRKFEKFEESTLKKIAKLAVQNERSQRLESFACPWCPFKSKGHINFRDHLQIHLGGMWPCTCYVIRKRSSSRSDDDNDNIEGGATSAAEKILEIFERPKNCPNCVSLCRQAFQLKIHLQTERRNVASIKCDQCQFKAITPSVLQVHVMRCHPTLECQLCDFWAQDIDSLTAHVRTHYGKRGGEDPNVRLTRPAAVATDRGGQDEGRGDDDEVK